MHVQFIFRRKRLLERFGLQSYNSMLHSSYYYYILDKRVISLTTRCKNAGFFPVINWEKPSGGTVDQRFIISEPNLGFSSYITVFIWLFGFLCGMLSVLCVLYCDVGLRLWNLNVRWLCSFAGHPPSVQAEAGGSDQTAEQLRFCNLASEEEAEGARRLPQRVRPCDVRLLPAAPLTPSSLRGDAFTENEQTRV